MLVAIRSLVWILHNNSDSSPLGNNTQIDMLRCIS